MKTIIDSLPVHTGIVIDGLSWCVVLCGVPTGYTVQALAVAS